MKFGPGHIGNSMSKDLGTRATAGPGTSEGGNVRYFPSNDDQAPSGVPEKSPPSPPHYRKELLKFFCKALLRNLEAHYRSAKRAQQWAVATSIASTVSGIMLLVLSVSDNLKAWFNASILKHYVAYETLNIVAGVVFVCLGISWLIQGFDGRVHAHKNAAVCFSQLRKEVLAMLGEKTLGAEPIRHVIEKYDQIVQMSPMIVSSLWDKQDKKTNEELSRMVENLYILSTGRP